MEQFAGYGNYSQQDFVNEAALANNPGAQGIESAQPVAANQPEVATTIVWETKDTSITDEGVSGDAAVANTSGEEVEAVVAEETGDKDFAEKAGKVVGDASTMEQMLANLNKSIDKEQNKRKKARLLAFGLALLGGESMSNALHYANQTPFFDDEDLNEMLDHRESMMSAIRDDVLRSQGLLPEPKSKKASGGGGAGGEYPELTATLQKEIRDLSKSYTTKRQSINRINALIPQIESAGGFEGAFGTGAEFLKGLAGGQDNVSLWKNQFTSLVNSEVVNSLPPGVASDRDIALIKSGFPDASWDKETVVRWMQTYARVAEYVAQQEQHRAEYIERTGRQTGWQSSFKPTASNAGSISSTSSSSDDSNVDLDLSDL